MVERDEVQELEQRVSRLEQEVDEIRRSVSGGVFSGFFTGFFAGLIVVVGGFFLC